MADPLVVAVLAWFHILSAILWFGGSSFFGFIFTPFLAKLSNSAQREFYLNFGEKSNLFFRVVSGMTVLFGVLLLYAYTNGNLSVLWTTSWGGKISVGMLLGLTAFLAVQLSTIPHFEKARKLLSQSKPSDQLSQLVEFQRQMKIGGISAGVTAALLFGTLVFMVGAGFY